MTKLIAAILAFISLVTACAAPQAQRTIEGRALRNPPADEAGQLVVTSMATTTLIITDGETTLITDGYFTRAKVDFSPEAGSRIEPDRAVVEKYVNELGISEAAAVMVVHSHFDHALDAPIVAELTGAELLGSESTANVGRGLNLPEEQIRVVVPGEPMDYGNFKVTFFISKHFALSEPYASMLSGSIDQPLVPPAYASDYKEGRSYSILLEHAKGNILIQGSAGFIPGALKGVQADYVMLGIGGLGNLKPGEQEQYFHELVTVTGGRKIFPIHWDSTTTPLDEPLVPYSDFERAMDFLEKKKNETGVSYGLLPLGEAFALE